MKSYSWSIKILFNKHILATKLNFSKHLIVHFDKIFYYYKQIKIIAFKFRIEKISYLKLN